MHDCSGSTNMAQREKWIRRTWAIFRRRLRLSSPEAPFAGKYRICSTGYGLLKASRWFPSYLGVHPSVAEVWNLRVSMAVSWSTESKQRWKRWHPTFKKWNS